MASPIVGGSTSITLIDEFAGLAFDTTPLGGVTLSHLSLSFPIAGVSIDETTLLGTFESESGEAELFDVSLSDETNRLQFLNLVVNTLTGRVFAMVQVNSANEGVPSVFVLGDDRSLRLSIPLEALAAAAFGFGNDTLSRLQTGSADFEVAPQSEGAIPEPSTLLMLTSGVALLWMGRRRFVR
ncbi:MAG: PEP-CTERM sorting domain-containing protein [Bryobacterales bacterium]|nr:PEP-CTERM sorting domain-containing protein [Bryobacterales bacterium]